MDAQDRRIALKVAAQHAAKQAVELAMAVSAVVESLKTDDRALRAVEDAWARGNIAAIRRELDDLEHLLAGREPPIPVAPAPKEAA